jgi:O-antigen ligase
MVKRLIGLALLPTIYIVVRMTDSRLGILGYLVSIVSYVLIWGIVRFRRRINDLMAAIIVYAYPAVFIAVLAASVFVHKIHVLIFGGGAQVASNDARQEQFRMAMPAFLRNPIGYGGGGSGPHMGYAAGDFVAIDSYWISLSLDYGALGVVLYVGVFAVIIYAAIKVLLRHPEMARGEVALLTPLIAFIAAFLMIRGVYAEDGIHPLVFALLGMAVCLISRAKQIIAATSPARVARAPVVPAFKRTAGAREASQEGEKPLSFASIVAIMLACAAGYYVACLVWSVLHH